MDLGIWIVRDQHGREWDIKPSIGGCLINVGILKSKWTRWKGVLEKYVGSVEVTNEYSSHQWRAG